MSEMPLVVVAEDDEDIRALIVHRMAKEGYEVLEAGDGEEALRLALECHPALAIVDVMMPKRDGLEVTRELRRSEVGSRTPVILLSARTLESDIALGFEAGADDYLRKPFSPVELGARVHALLGRR
jgi:DNA-binding response OmpR family regulator